MGMAQSPVAESKLARGFGVLGPALALALIAICQSRPSLAEGIITHPGEHLDYAVELEPHGLFAPFDPPGDTIGTGFGAGLRATIPIVKNGFINTINNSVGITFGFDWLRYSGQDVVIGPCAQWIAGPNGTSICTQVAGPTVGPANYVYLPIALQWNFWLHEQFSVFGEPGVVIYYRKPRYQGSADVGPAPMFDIGGRWHFSQPVALTFRLGYPTFSLGISCFL